MPNVGALRGQEADVPPVLADGVRGAAIGLELDEESLEGFPDSTNLDPRADLNSRPLPRTIGRHVHCYVVHGILTEQERTLLFLPREK